MFMDRDGVQNSVPKAFVDHIKRHKYTKEGLVYFDFVYLDIL